MPVLTRSDAEFAFEDVVHPHAVAEAGVEDLADLGPHVDAHLVEQRDGPDREAEVHQRAVELGGTGRDVSVLFSDIRGFTTLTEALPPEEVIELLNTYYTLMFDAISGHGGVVNQMVGSTSRSISFYEGILNSRTFLESVLDSIGLATITSRFPRYTREDAINFIQQNLSLRKTVYTSFLELTAHAGDKELALQQLETGLRAPNRSLVLSYGALKLHPFWDPLRGDPRFEKIVASLAPKEMVSK